MSIWASFRSLETTADGRLTKGKIYKGVNMKLRRPSPTMRPNGSIFNTIHRIGVFDNKKQWMTFSPYVFERIGT